MKVTQLPAHPGPRERLIKNGPAGLTDVELLAIILRTGYQHVTATDVATTVLKKYSLQQLTSISTTELAGMKGIGISRACSIHAALALGRLQTAAQPISVNNPALVYQLTQSLAHKKQEHLVCLYLNARHQLIDQQTISIGTVNSSVIHPREVFAPALEKRAVAVILVHNHPSADPQPSEEDIAATDKMVEAGKLIDIEVLDHVIIGGSQWFSLKQHQLL